MADETGAPPISPAAPPSPTPLAVPAVQTAIYPQTSLRQEIGKLRREIVQSIADTEEGAQRVAAIDKELQTEDAQEKQAQTDRQRVSEFLFGEVKDKMELAGITAIPEWDTKILPVWQEAPQKGYEMAKAAIRQAKAAQNSQREASVKTAPPSAELIANETGARAAPPHLDALLQTPVHNMSLSQLKEYQKAFNQALGLKGG